MRLKTETRDVVQEKMNEYTESNYSELAVSTFEWDLSKGDITENNG